MLVISHPLLIHILIVLLIIAACHVVKPFLIIQVPANGLLDAFLKLQTWFPTEFSLQFGRVDGIAEIMTGTVGNVGYQVQAVPLWIAQQTVNGLDDNLYNVNVLPFVETADVVCLVYLTVVEYHVDGTGMVNNIEQVAHVLALAIDRQWLAVTDIVNEQRDEFLRELIRTVVV